YQIARETLGRLRRRGKRRREPPRVGQYPAVAVEDAEPVTGLTEPGNDPLQFRTLVDEAARHAGVHVEARSDADAVILAVGTVDVDDRDTQPVADQVQRDAYFDGVPVRRVLPGARNAVLVI